MPDLPVDGIMGGAINVPPPAFPMPIGFKAQEPRKRLSRAARERHILNEAIRFFAEVGFEGQTRALAQRLGVTQPLLYRYFPSKESLIERVYQEIYVSRWNAEWEALLRDRAIPLVDRLKRIYQEYTSAIFTYEWVRIFVFSGLKGVNINARYLQHIRDRLILPVCAEIRDFAGLPSPEEKPITDAEIEMAWGLHGGIFYIAVRKFIYGVPVPEDLRPLLDSKIDCFLNGAAETVRPILDGTPP